MSVTTICDKYGDVIGVVKSEGPPASVYTKNGIMYVEVEKTQTYSLYPLIIIAIFLFAIYQI